jgi:hypothetical protein
LQANAQWLPDRAYSEGPGIRVGDLELHPGVAVRGGYDNNVFRSDGDATPIRDAAILAITPHLYLSTETPQRGLEGEDRLAAGQAPRFVAFRGGASATYLHYFTDNAPRNLAVDTDFFLAVAQGRPVELNLVASYVRSVAPFTEVAGDRNAYVFDTVDPSLRLKFNSRSGVLSGYIGYAPRYTHYESNTFDYLNNIQHGIEAGTAWKFLPSTALLYDARFAFQNYTNYTPTDERLMLFSDNQSFRTRLGLNGALTNKLSLRLLAGYAVGFYDRSELDEFEDGVGEAVLTYTFGPHSFDVGYQRDVVSSPLGAWSQIDRGFTKIAFLFARRFALRLEAGAAHANYGSLLRVISPADDTMDDAADGVTGIGVGGDRTRDDIRLDGAIRTEYRATNWLAFMADFTVQSVITDFDYDLSRANGQVIPDPADFTAMQIFGGVRAHY